MPQVLVCPPMPSFGHVNGTTHLKPPDMAWDLAVPELIGRMAAVGVESHVSPVIDIR